MSGSNSSFISSSTDGFLVDLVFFLYLWRCPIAVCIDFGRCRRTPSTVNPGNVDNLLFLIASIKVATGGPPRTP